MNVMVEKVLLAAFLIGFWAMVLVHLTGCGGSTGWAFQVGVTPINQVDNQQVLQPKNQNKATYAKK